MVGGGALTPGIASKYLIRPNCCRCSYGNSACLYKSSGRDSRRSDRKNPSLERSDLEILLTFSEPVEDIKLVWKEFRPITSEIPVDEFAAEEDRTRIVSPTLPIPHLPDFVSADGKSARIRLTAIGSGRFEFHLLIWKDCKWL